ncbi:MAG: FkbM family methyltransferase [Candidatus Sungbacteria bacterium]|nr:FkbM family methyltransferase [Candidatus Sungbacteria bacterium]
MNKYAKDNQVLLLSALSNSEKLLGLYHNKNREPRYINRLKKFLKNPYKYLRINLAKAGIISHNGYAETFWGENLYLPLADENITTLYYCGALGASECRLTRFIIKNMNPSDIFYDVGANYGFYSTLASYLIGRETGQVHIFEPNPSAIYYIRKNMDADGKKIFINEVGVADTEGTAVFYDTVEGGKGGMSTMLKETVLRWKLPFKEIRVKTITLDDYALAHAPPTFLKIDVDGSEKKVIRGAVKMLKSAAPIIAMEVWDANHVKADTMEALKLLQNLGYESYRIDEKGEIQREFLDVYKNPVGEFSNFIFKK